MRKHLIDHSQSAPECRAVELQSCMYVVEEKDQIFGSHIAGEVVLGHGAAAITAQGAVVAAAAITPGGVDLFPPVVGLGMQVRTELDFGIGRYQVAE